MARPSSSLFLGAAVAVALAVLAAAPSALAADPDPLQDLCVADLNSAVDSFMCWYEQQCMVGYCCSCDQHEEFPSQPRHCCWSRVMLLLVLLYGFQFCNLFCNINDAKKLKHLFIS
uniref:Embryo surrounding factor 1 brassicaceae domain-containing protein n=1 Tax=Setaria italica TaxID=4555 RepID=K3XNB2_SETIT